jgi:dihydrofolate reductase
MISGHVFIAASLDGFIARQDGSIDWLLSRDDPQEEHGFRDFIDGVDGMVMGRGGYEAAAALDRWPHEKPALVLSRQLARAPVPEKLEGRLRFSDLAPRAAMEMLESEGWSRVYVDGGLIIQSFLREGLIADLVVTHVPVLIGTGRQLFGPIRSDVALTHLGTTAFPSGLVQSRYRVDPSNGARGARAA